MKRVCGTCLFGIDSKAKRSGINVLCAYDNQWHLDRTEGCVKWKETTGGLSKKDRIDLADRLKEKEDTERRHQESIHNHQTIYKNKNNAITHKMNFESNVLIVTATKVESEAVIAIFHKATGNIARPKRIADRIYHDLGEINGMRLFLALSEQGAGGLGASQQAIQKGIDSLKPSAVIMVGIAFGINEQKQAIGDILVSKQLWLYELQRVGTSKIIPRGDKSHASPHLLNHFRSFDLYQKEPKANVHFGLVLTGEKLVDNVDYREGLKAFEPDAIGGEMEGTGLYVACHDSKVDWIMVKAICDWADGHKADNKNQRQQLAATNAASFVLHSLQMASIISENSPSKGLSTVESADAKSLPKASTYADLKSELTANFQQIKKLSYSSDQDSELKRLIIYGLNKDVPELVSEYISHLSYSSDRDKIYKVFIDYYINTKKHHMAEKLIDKLSYSSDQDTARKKLLNARIED